MEQRFSITHERKPKSQPELKPIREVYDQRGIIHTNIEDMMKIED